MFRLRTSNVPKDLQELAKVAVIFYADRCMKKSTRNRIEEIYIKFRKFSAIDDAADIKAYADFEDNERRLPTEYVVLFNDKNRDICVRDFLSILFHELTHVNQFATGQLQERTGYSLWEGKPIPFDMNYWEQPWEIDANGREASCYALFKEKYPELNLPKLAPLEQGRSLSGWKPLEKQVFRIAAKSMT